MFDVKGRQIQITAGDTGLMAVRARESGYVPTGEDRAVFTVRERTGGRVLLKKVLVPDETGCVQIPFSNADTENLRAGAYVWDIRYALHAVMDAKGNVTGGREVVTPFAPAPFLVMEAVGAI